MEMLLLMVVMFGGLFLMSQFSRRQAKKRADERAAMLAEKLVPGAWVQTYSAFFGRFVDQDGDVVILETPGGEETYWLEKAISGVIDPPFEVLEDITFEEETQFDVDGDMDQVDEVVIDDVDVFQEEDFGSRDVKEEDQK